MTGGGIGKREVGKTTFLFKMMEWAPTRVVIDPRGQFLDHTDAEYFGTDPGDPMLDRPRFREALDRAGKLIVFPRADVEGTVEAVCEELSDWTRAYPEERVALLLDEARSIFRGDARRIPPALDVFMRESARGQTLILATAHRPTDLPTDYRAIMDLWIWFQLDFDDDLETVRRQCGEEAARRVGELGPRRALVVDTRGGDRRRLVPYDDPTTWYTPLQAKAPAPAPLAPAATSATSAEAPARAYVWP